MHKPILPRSTVTLSAAASPWARLPHPLLRGVIEIRLFRSALVAHGGLAELIIELPTWAYDFALIGQRRYGISSRSRAENLRGQ